VEQSIRAGRALPIAEAVSLARRYVD
jgi:hypothetical protein